MQPTQLGGFTTNFNVGFAINADGGSNVGGNDSEVFQTQLGVLHDDTGLFGIIALQTETADNADVGSGDDTDAIYIKGGIKRGFNRYGDSAIYGEFGSYNDQFGVANVDGVTGSELLRLGVVVEQHFGSDLIVYGKVEQYSLDISGSAGAQAIYDGADDLVLATIGVTYFFSYFE